MIRHGVTPYLECSSKGDKRLSAFYARLPEFGNRSIEELYQAYKVFDNGITGLSIKEAKGKHAINQQECAKYYYSLWYQYIARHHDLQTVLMNATGLSDMFGQVGHVCQATVLWDIRNFYISQHPYDDMLLIDDVGLCNEFW